MKKNTRFILSIIGLVFMLSFTVMTIISLYDNKILGGALMYIGLISGVIGVVIYLFIMRDNRIKNQNEAMQAEADINAKNHLEGSLIDKSGKE